MLEFKFKYDVAFSFLQQDEPLAIQLNDRLQDRMSTFLYSDRQKEVAGTDGEETFGRVFREEARLVIVLYRAGWGKTKWTRIEETAIRARGFELGYSFAKFLPLDEPPALPRWLPQSQIYIGLKRFGLDGAAAVIEARVSELGGDVHEETIEERAKRAERAMAFDKRREEFQWDKGVRAAREAVADLKKALATHAEAVKAATSIALEVGERHDGFWLLGLGRALGISWRQESGNNLAGACLQVRLMSHLPAGPGQWNPEKPIGVKSIRFSFDLLSTDEGGWILQDAQKRSFATDALADYLIKLYLEHGRRT